MCNQIERETANGKDKVDNIFWIDARPLVRDGQEEIELSFFVSKWVMTLPEAIELYNRIEKAVDTTQGL